jgi:hypothetical protein
MERRMMKALRAIGITALLALTLVVCSNPFDIVSSVATQVKISNNKFLVVKGMGPFAANDQNVNPCTTIWIQFDRDLDFSTVGTQTISLNPSQTWTPSYDSATKTLHILPVSLEGQTSYTLTIQGLKGADGSEMQSGYPLAFRTKAGPSGTMTINSGAAYTNIASATLNFSVNATTTQVRWSFFEEYLTTDANDTHSSLWQIKAPSFPQSLGADGPKTIYYQLYDGTNTSPGYDAVAGTHPLSASVTLDTVPPNAAPVVTAPTSPTASPIPRWTWTKNSTTGGEATPIYRVFLDGVQVKDKTSTSYYVPPLKPPVLCGLSEGNHSIQVWETDNAGNLSAPSVLSSVTVSGIPNLVTSIYTPTFYWPTLWDKKGYPSEVYLLHIGLNFAGGKMDEITAIEVKPVESKEQVQSYYLSTTLKKYSGSTVFWYVDFPRQGVRSPADPSKAWSFALP